MLYVTLTCMAFLPFVFPVKFDFALVIVQIFFQMVPISDLHTFSDFSEIFEALFTVFFLYFHNMVARNVPREIKIPCQQNLLCKHEASFVEGATDLSLGLNHYRLVTMNYKTIFVATVVLSVFILISYWSSKTKSKISGMYTLCINEKLKPAI